MIPLVALLSYHVRWIIYAEYSKKFQGPQLS